MKKIVLLLPIALLLASCSSTSTETSATSKIEVGKACDFLLKSLNEDQLILDQQDQDRASSNAQIAKDDPAFAEALMDYPSLSYGILYGDNWNQHALRMIAMYGQSSKMVKEDLSFSAILKDSGFVWAKRLVLHQTKPGKLKGKLSDEQIELDMRESNTNRPIIRKTCVISSNLLP